MIPSKLKDVIKLKSLSKDTLRQKDIKTSKHQQEQEKHTQDLLKQAIIEINRVGNNINQIARTINEKRKIKDKLFNNNLTAEERERMLQATQELENIILKIRDKNMTEQEADLMLYPIISKYVKQIQNGTFVGRTLEEIKAECLQNIHKT
jgi:hypothetical protein